jgi:hypothetical protein
MSQENVEIVRRFYEVAAATYASIEVIQEAHEKGDFGEFLPATEAILTSDVVVRAPEDSNFPDTGLHAPLYIWLYKRRARQDSNL